MTYVHVSQYAVGASDVTRHSGCTWSAGASGVAATTGGAKHPTPDAIHALVARTEETSPTTPGWSLPDLALAMKRYGQPFTDHTGGGWAAVLAQLAGGHYVVLQGVSAVFADATCSGAFDGDHAIGVHPMTRTVDGIVQHWIDDPICPSGRWEQDAYLRRYAQALAPGVRFGAFTDPVPAPPKRYVVSVRRLIPWHQYAVSGTTAVKVRRWFTRTGWHAQCSAPRTVFENGAPLHLVQITEPGHKFHGWWVKADAWGITVKEV